MANTNETGNNETGNSTGVYFCFDFEAFLEVRKGQTGSDRSKWGRSRDNRGHMIQTNPRDRKNSDRKLRY